MKEISDFRCNLIRSVKKKSSNLNQDVMVKITKDDIKDGLGRQRLKKVTIEKLKKDFEKSGLRVDDCDNDLCVTIPVDKLKSNVFTYKELSE